MGSKQKISVEPDYGLKPALVWDDKVVNMTVGGSYKIWWFNKGRFFSMNNSGYEQKKA